MQFQKEFYKIRLSSKENIYYWPLQKVIVSTEEKIQEDLEDCITSKLDLATFTKKYPDLTNTLIDKGLIAQKQAHLPRLKKFSLNPTSATIILTQQCQLNCAYCYSEANLVSKPIDLDTVNTTINFLVQNAILSNTRFVRLRYLGGGEPTIAWDTLKSSMSYAQELSRCENLELSASVNTNGILSYHQRDWLQENFSEIKISFDGLPRYQNSQRPFRGGSFTTDHVLKSIQFFCSNAKTKLTIHTVITNSSVNHMVEMIDYIANIAPDLCIEFEPQAICGRSLATQCSAPSPEDFATNFISALEVGLAKGMKVKSSVFRLNEIVPRYCNAAGLNIVVTPQGTVTSCHEVLDPSDHRFELFYLGKIKARTNQININPDSFYSLYQRNIYNLEQCKLCAFKWHCAGNCLARSALETSLVKPWASTRCKTTRCVCKNAIAKFIQKPELAASLGFKIIKYK